MCRNQCQGLHLSQSLKLILLLSVVSHRKLFKMLVIISRTNGFISLNFGTMHLRVEEINVQWNEGSFRPNLVQSINPLTKVIKVCPNDRLNYFTLEDNSKIVRIQWKIRWQFKAILLQKHRVNFNKTKLNASLISFEQTSPRKAFFLFCWWIYFS